MYTKKLGQLIKPFICKQIEQSDRTFPKQSKNHFNTQEKEVSINSLRVLLTRHYFFFQLPASLSSVYSSLIPDKK